MKTWNERLARALAESEYGPHQLAQALGLKTPSISAWIGAGTIKPAQNLTGENLLRVCEVLRIRPEWLMFEKGPMHSSVGKKLTPEMQSVIDALIEIDAIGGTEREDALYFVNRLLKSSVRGEQKIG